MGSNKLHFHLYISLGRFLDLIGTEIFAKEPELEKIIAGAKS